MSTTLVLLPIVVGSWPAYSALLTSVAVTMGYKLCSELNEIVELKNCKADASAAEKEEVEVPVESTQKIVSSMKDGDSLSFTNGDFVVTFLKDPRGMCKCRVSSAAGKKAHKAALDAEARKIINRVTQTYVYQKLKAELSQKGYNITQDEVKPDSPIRLTVRKWK